MLASAHSSLAALLLARLQAAGCVRGYFQAFSAKPPYSLTGQLAAGATVLLPDTGAEPRCEPLVNAFFSTNYSSGYACLLIELDAVQGRTVYALRTSAQQLAHAGAEAQWPQIGIAAGPRNRMPFGPVLAEQVAAALDQGRALMPYHRDYCGMGFERHNGHYTYGEVWDGHYLEPQLIFSSREDFVDWLARQSNKSLARLEETDPWYWNNQTITRQRLKSFVQ